MEHTITLFSISELLEKTFYIPSYQRGYRWNKEQVEDLLNDINEFDNTRDGKFYCLQPLVVKGIENSWIVIDGQQRLTTICLILNYLVQENGKEIILEYQREKHLGKLSSFEFDIESRIEDKDQLWKNHIEGHPNDDNIEFFHLFIAKLVIHSWFKDQIDGFKGDLKHRLLRDVKFIWYDVGEADEHELFKNLNSGKIALTNAELIKALFLNNTGIEISGKELKQNLIAEEFDQMERNLREDDFWYFLAGNNAKPSSCIDLLFDLMLDTSDEKHRILKESKDKFRTFFYFKNLIYNEIGPGIKSDEQVYENAKTVWKNVQTYYYNLLGWNKNADTFNLIGYLRSLRTPKSLAEIYLLFCNTDKTHNKTEFLKQLKDICKKEMDFEGKAYLALNYKSSNVRNLLLLLNIATLLSKSEEKVKFSFADFHKYDWDIEHISPQSPKSIDDFIVEYGKEKLPLELQNWKEKTSEEKHQLLEKYTTSEPDELENLTLLTSHDNRGIGNKYFFEKRELLKSYYQQGSFIPPCSMNVFVKFYTINPQNLNFWNQDEDGQAYITFIENTIENFFRKENGND